MTDITEAIDTAQRATGITAVSVDYRRGEASITARTAAEAHSLSLCLDGMVGLKATAYDTRVIVFNG